MELSRAELSRLINISKQGIQRAVEYNKLKLNNNGKIDTDDPFNFTYLDNKGLFKGLPSYETSKKGIKPKVKEKTKNIEKIKYELSQMPFEDLYKDSLFLGKPFSLLRERERILTDRARRQKIEIENDCKRGILVERKTVESFVFNYLQVLSNRLFDIPDSFMIDLLSIVNSNSNEHEKQIQGYRLLNEKITQLIQETKKIINLQLNKILTVNENETNVN